MMFLSFILLRSFFGFDFIPYLEPVILKDVLLLASRINSNANISNLRRLALRKKIPYSEFCLPVFSCIRTEYGPEKLRIQTLFTQCSFFKILITKTAEALINTLASLSNRSWFIHKAANLLLPTFLLDTDHFVPKRWNKVRKWCKISFPNQNTNYNPDQNILEQTNRYIPGTPPSPL